ncbi:hypothetical protein B0H12DRAFT_162919 [Mycena haematopus]|nr:hypothetical protein B0H12DRAFT_162919 [Mycena haematopus]
MRPNDSEESLFGTDSSSTPDGRVRRLSDPGGRPSERLSRVPNRRQSDPGREFSTFALRPNTLRPGTQSMNSRNEGRRLSSHADTSSATQSFVSFDTETPTNNSAAGFATASDGEDDIDITPQYRTYDTPARSNTVYAPRTAGQRLDPRRAATLDPRLAGQASYSSAPQDHEDPDDSVLAAVLDAGDETVRGPGGTPQRRGTREAMTSNSFTPQGDTDPVPNVVLDARDGTVRRPERVPQRGGTRERSDSNRRDVATDVATNYPQQSSLTSSSAGDRTVRRPEGFPQPQDASRRRDARDARNVATDAATQQSPSLPLNSYSDANDQAARRTGASPQRRAPGEGPQRRPAQDVSPNSPQQPMYHPLNSSSAQEASVPPESDPRRGHKISEASTVVPNKFSASGADAGDTSRPSFQESSRPSFQESRQRIPSAASNRPPQSGSRLPPTAPTDPRQQAPPAPTTYPPPGRTGSTAPPPPGPPKATPPAPRQDEAVYPPPRRTAPTALPTNKPALPTNKPAPPTRQEPHTPQTPTTIRPSNASNRPLVPPKPQPARKVPPMTAGARRSRRMRARWTRGM